MARKGKKRKGFFGMIVGTIVTLLILLGLIHVFTVEWFSIDILGFLSFGVPWLTKVYSLIIGIFGAVGLLGFIAVLFNGRKR